MFYLVHGTPWGRFDFAAEGADRLYVVAGRDDQVFALLARAFASSSAVEAERDYLRAMAEVAVVNADGKPVRMGSATEPESELGGGSGAELESVPTSEVAKWLGKQPQSLSPARDALLKKGLIYSTERGRIAFTVPHFGRYLRDHP